MTTSTRLLIVDDEPAIREVLRLVLELRGFTIVAEAGNGRAAVEAVETNDLDAVIMDVQMPVLDGIGATAEISAVAPTLPVIFYSAFVDESMRRAGIAAGASGWVLKGSGSQALVAELDRVVGRLADAPRSA